jgi:hypothetical protein
MISLSLWEKCSGNLKTRHHTMCLRVLCKTNVTKKRLFLHYACGEISLGALKFWEGGILIKHDVG